MLKNGHKTTNYVEKPLENRQKCAKTVKKTPKISKNHRKWLKNPQKCSKTVIKPLNMPKKRQKNSKKNTKNIEKPS